MNYCNFHETLIAQTVICVCQISKLSDDPDD